MENAADTHRKSGIMTIRVMAMELGRLALARATLSDLWWRDSIIAPAATLQLGWPSHFTGAGN